LERFADQLDLAQFRIDQVTELAIAAIRKQSGLTAGRESCIDCGDSIPPKRLLYVPNAIRCASCQDQQERQGTQRSANRSRIDRATVPIMVAAPGQLFGASSSIGTGRRKRSKD
jgi:phage/conjugal plasmid C-4 type zinc finger TraR family protein